MLQKAFSLKTLAVGLASAFAFAGCAVEAPNSDPGAGNDPLLSVDIPEGFTFATSRPLSLRVEMPAEELGRSLAEVRLADGALVYRGPLLSPASIHVPVGTETLQVGLRGPDGSRELTVSVEGDEAVVRGQ